ncbi:sensor histidine kinase [Sulfurospirillum arcachonense]|uniref:sensor histidine kinase n=1 Tax=Sulfurospirillum arcachonense TaxID=57666 RepID=UPI00146FA82A|nr:sensor histidine kinase [Sulfurospirillum arcachonense]
MKSFNTDYNQEIRSVIKTRRKKVLLAMYILCMILFFTLILKDMYIGNYMYTFPKVIGIFFIFISFFTLYKKMRYNYASYAILFIVGITTILTIFINQFHDFTPVFIIPFSISTFFLFSWKKGIFINLVFFITFSFIIIFNENHFNYTDLMRYEASLVNFIIIILVIFIFTYIYEITRVESYKMLLSSNTKKDLLYNEIHHRVKNNLNIVSSMLAMQAQQENKQVQKILSTSKARIDSMALVHSMLYVSHDLEKVNAKEFIEKLTLNLINSSTTNIQIEHKIKNIALPLNEIMPIGLIINELLTNSIKYAFINQPDPKILIVLKIVGKKVLLIYHDNGLGINNEKENLGLKLVKLNVKQLKGSLETKQNGGLMYKIKFTKTIKTKELYVQNFDS